MGQQSQEKPKIQPLNPEKRRPEPKQPAKPKRKLPRFLIRLIATLVVVAVALARTLTA